MDKRGVLIGLARIKELTPERAYEVRVLLDPEVQARLLAWGVTDPEVLACAGIHPTRVKPRTDGTRRHSRSDTERLVDLHLFGLGLDDAESITVEWVSLGEAQNAFLDSTWESMVAGRAPEWAVDKYPGRVARVLGMEGEAWAPLKELVRNDILPFGLTSSRKFLLVDGQTL